MAQMNAETKRLEAERYSAGKVPQARAAAAELLARARSESTNKVAIAKAEANAVAIITEAVSGFGVNPTQYLIALRYIETFVSIAMHASKRLLYFPFETDVVGSVTELQS